jgi:hypothetical protein
MSPHNTPAGYTIRLTYGEIVQFLKAMASQTGAFRAIGNNPFFSLLMPELGDSVEAAAAHIDSITRPVVEYLTAQGVPRPDAPGRLADDALVQLSLATEQLQLLGELCPLCVTSWQALLDGLPTAAPFAEVRAHILSNRKEAEEGAAGMLRALAIAGVPSIPGL